ncbi:RNA-binding domain-containing protein [Schizophyllum commune H4-8]|uniref:RNA-binding domain-containing protein n=1 Tax=Schizophyllum commune (strain H4-8 / FGSC 9210) TaxID=578458 RepID=UPI0021607FF0|nr:RNA-binding domain-containing protein [Schizophyllum commune H4-8]KAI5899462.1 RNA-binding domain-containing protein [Schizophyllum commune H4-8]
MEEGTKNKKTIFVGGLVDEVNEATLFETFSTFGDVVEVQLPPATTNPNQQQQGIARIAFPPPGFKNKHRGFAFVTFTSSADAQDAIDNMDLNELQGKVIKVNLAKPQKAPVQGAGNRAVWETEEWLQTHLKPLAQSGGKRIPSLRL